MSTTTLLDTLLPARYQRAITVTFFGLLLALGLSLVRDYGVSFDEGVQRVSGQISLFYVFHKLPASLQYKLLPPEAAALIKQKGADRQLSDYGDRDYGVLFELPASAAEQVLRIHDKRQIYLLRHTLNYLVCYLGFIAFYVIVARRFGSWRVGLLGTLLLVLTPRLFADYFYNDKDAVFLALFTVGIATAVPLIQRPTWRTALWHALACACAVDVRIMGMLLPAATLAFVGLRAVRGEYRGQRILGPLGLYLGLLVGFIVIFWPYLWEQPLAHFTSAWQAMSRFRWPGDVLYQGQLIKGTLLPWHYSLVWIGLTVPLLYLLFFGVGTAGLLVQVVRRNWRLYASDAEWQDLLFLGLAVAPLAAVIVLHSVLYNGWRQLYFVYPSLLLVALRGLVAAWHWQPAGLAAGRYWRPALGLGVGLSLAVIAGRMVRLHPLENMYFNALAPTQTDRYYDGDYWGLSYSQGLAWIAQHDARPRIKVFSSLPQPLILNHLIQPAGVQERLELVYNLVGADYALTTYFYQYPPIPTGQPRYTLRAEGLRVLDIYQLR